MHVYYNIFFMIAINFAGAGDPEKKYAIQLFYQPIENYWNAKFAVTQNLNALIKVS